MRLEKQMRSLTEKSTDTSVQMEEMVAASQQLSQELSTLKVRQMEEMVARLLHS